MTDARIPHVLARAQRLHALHPALQLAMVCRLACQAEGITDLTPVLLAEMLQQRLTQEDEAPATSTESGDPEFLTSDEVMARLRLPQATFYRLLAEGKLPAFKLGRNWRIRRAALDAYIQEQERRNQWAME